MKTAALPVPGIVLGAYPERRAASGALPARAGWLGTLPDTLTGFGLRRYRRFVAEVRLLDADTARLDDAAIGRRVRQLRANYSRDGLTDALIAEAFTLIGRTCALELGKVPYDSQLMAARIMLDNRLAEMATGEGKTLAAAICAATAAMAGIPVHVVTANDYLVERDARALEPLYRALGLNVAAVTQSMTHEQRQRAYGCDIAYCTAKELVFDYLRDGLGRDRTRSDLHLHARRLDAGIAAAERPTLLRGLCMAILDEADSILIDDARVPLVLSERSRNASNRQYHEQALELAAALAIGTDFTLERQRMSACLTGSGRARLERSAGVLGTVWHNRLHREESVSTALAAVHLYERDRHYVLREGAVTIVDESTGRIAPGRVWSRGLHQMIELKEGCEPADETTTSAQMTYQRFFQRYLSLGGMSGTLREARVELASLYALQVVEVPLHRQDRRRITPTRVYRDSAAQQRAAIREAKMIRDKGRPVLIGTDSVAESERLSALLTAAGLPHRVLNARQDRAEAQIIAAAGQPGQITVATNMAGRGTDIELGPGVAARGGLHVICCQHNASARIDRQLLGRCARQGDPGSAQSLLALDKPMIARLVPRWLARRVREDGMRRPAWLINTFVRMPQRLEERRQRAQRRNLLEQDLRTERNLSFGKPNE
jgi:preprotein translocase subunit SecA